MSALAMTVSDTLVLARRNLRRIPRQPDLLIAYTIQPVMFVLLFVYVFGGAIDSGPFDYVDFLMPGIIVQSIAFGGFVTALGLSEDVFAEAPAPPADAEADVVEAQAPTADEEPADQPAPEETAAEEET